MEQQKDLASECSCPVCRRTGFTKKEIRKNNGIIGPGYASRPVDEWYECDFCTCRFSKLPLGIAPEAEKPELETKKT